MRIRKLAVLIGWALLLAACTPESPAGGSESATATTTTTPVTTTSTAPTTTSTVPTTTTSTTTTSTTTTTIPVTGPTTLTADGVLRITEDVPFTSELSLDIYEPIVPGPYPVVVLFHGGGWLGGRPDDIAPLARELAAAGTVVFNAPYRLALRGGGYPMTFEDAACAVRAARAYGPEFGGDSETVTLVGYSAGAHIGAVAALAGDSFLGDCVVESGSALPDSFVGVAGPYDSDLLDPFLVMFFGTSRAEDPGPWEAGNPFSHIGANPDLSVRLIQGQSDLLVPAGFALSFHDALVEAGYDVGLTIVEKGNHQTVVDPLADGGVVVARVLEVAG